CLTGMPTQCVMCEAYPKAVHGYAQHLTRRHKSNLHSNGICDHEVRSDRFNPDLSKNAQSIPNENQ
ncbi:hypothetical protein PENTCL1PPCAC_19689, partial [Pristionchus entomophagus]